MAWVLFGLEFEGMQRDQEAGELPPGVWLGDCPLLHSWTRGETAYMPPPMEFPLGLQRKIIRHHLGARRKNISVGTEHIIVKGAHRAT